MIFLMSTLLVIAQYDTGFVVDTLVRTGRGYASLGTVAIGDKVISYVPNWGCVERPITHVLKHITHRPREIFLPNTHLVVAAQQQFYQPREQKWCTVAQLRPGDFLQQYTNRQLLVSSIVTIYNAAEIYSLHIQEPNNFYVSRENILTKGFLPTLVTDTTFDQHVNLYK